MSSKGKGDLYMTFTTRIYEIGEKPWEVTPPDSFGRIQEIEGLVHPIEPMGAIATSRHGMAIFNDTLTVDQIQFANLELEIN